MKLNLIRRFSVVLLLAFSVQSFAQIDLSKPIPVDPNVKMGKLENGLTYYIRKNAKPENKVELRLAVNAGSILEDDSQRGLAHFMEHMNFNGSKNFPKNELVDYLQKIGVKFGADLNAYTGFDETVYILPIPTEDPENVEKGFLVLEDWAFNNLLDPSEIDKERGVVLEESRLSKGAQQRMLRQYFPKLFNGSLYAERLPIGTDSILSNFEYATLENFYRQWYRPNQMAVIVVGDIDPVEAEKKIKAHFGKYKNPANAKPRPDIIPIQERTMPEVMVVTDEENPNTVLQVFHFIKPSKKVNTWADYRQTIIEDLVNTLINQRLQELTQTEKPPFLYGFTGKQGFIRGYDAYASVAVIGDNTAKEAIDALVAEAERARRFGFLPAELERAKATLLNDAEKKFNEREKSQSGQLVQGYLQHFLQGDPVMGAENYFKFISQVVPEITVQEINEEARQMPSTNNAFTLLLAPAASKEKLPSESELLKDLVAATNQDVKPYEEKAIATSLMETAPTAGKITKETKNEKLGTVNLTLSNGVTVTIKPTKFKEDEIMMDAWRWGGWHRFPLDLKNNAQYAADIVNEMGVGTLSPTDLEKFLSGKTVSVFPYLNEHEEGIQGNSSIKDFETFLQLTNLYFTQPRKDESLFKSMVNKQKGFLKFVKDNPMAYFQDTIVKIVYNNSPWVSAIPSVEDFNSLDVDKALAIYKRIYGNAYGMHFTFVGNIDPETAKPLLEKYLGSLPAQKMEPAFKDNNIRQVEGVVNVNIKKGMDEKSQVKIFWSGETKYTEDANLKLKALLDVLNIKVIEKLREELGGMYSGGLGGNIMKRPYVHYSISATIPCGPENVDKLTNAFFEIVKNAQDGNISQTDLDKVKETLKKQFQTSKQNNSYWLDHLAGSFINETNPEKVLEFEKRVDALTIKDLVDAANKYLSMENYVRTVLYPENAKVPDGVQKTF